LHLVASAGFSMLSLLQSAYAYVTLFSTVAFGSPKICLYLLPTLWKSYLLYQLFTIFHGHFCWGKPLKPPC